jgi:plastocyanin
MTATQREPRGRAIPSWFILGVATVALVVATVALTASLLGRSAGMMGGYGPGGMMGGYGPGGMMGGYGPGGMMGGYGPGDGGRTRPQPGQSGFVPGTASAPRVIEVLAGPGYSFYPASIAIARGETVTFEVTSMGGLVHEFMVGPADAVAADADGTPEVAGIGMMQTRSLTYTFDGDGPYAFACHAPGHYEAGMRGSIAVLAP